MNLETTNRATGAAVGFVIATVLFVALAIFVKLSVSAPAIDADRAAERSQALAEIRAAEDKSLNALTWADPARGMVHLPIATAMSLAAQAWQNPAAARADLIARAAKAAAPAPKTAPKPSAFE